MSLRVYESAPATSVVDGLLGNLLRLVLGS
jgi:hypothetical protein